MDQETHQHSRSLGRRRLSFSLILSITAIWLFTGAGINLYHHYQNMLAAPFEKWKASFFLVVLFYLATLLFTFSLLWSQKVRDVIINLREYIRPWNWFPVLLTAVGAGSFYVFFNQSEIFFGFYTRLMIYGMAILLMSTLLSKGHNLFERQSVLVALLLLAGFFEILYNFQHVVDYPFSLYWSEGNRMWDYSVRFGRSLYIIPPEVPINAYIDIGRQSLWGMIFLFPHISIVGMRFWNAVVFVLPSIFLGMFLFRCEKETPLKWLLLALWSFLFLNQGPIYSPLVLAAVLVAASRNMRLLPAMILVGLASYYARSSRITWTFAPAILAAIMAIADSPTGTQNTRFFLFDLIVRWKRAIFLAISGLVGGFFLQDVLPMLVARAAQVQTEATPLSMEGIQEAGGRQPLLWERLLPNPTNPEGILPSLLLATGPVIILLLYYAIKKRSKDLWSSIVIAGAMLAFLIVGLVASVKIGGGSNLHNMDMFLIGILFSAGLAWGDGLREKFPQYLNKHTWLTVLLLAAVILPATRDLMQAVPLNLPSKNISQKALTDIQKIVADANQQGEVLFIDQRQLLTFGSIQNVPLIPEYEKKLMMDMAMANDGAYFKDFYRDLAHHRFTLIVNEPSWIRYQGEDYNFGNENDVWVRWVSTPLLCQYEPLKTYEEVGVQLLVPRTTPLDKGVKCPQLTQE